MAQIYTIFENVFVKSWWVIVFIIGCYMLYEQGLKRREMDFLNLSKQYQHLVNEKEMALKVKDEYLLQINSQSDPAWIEMTLMKGLGLVPEGQVKFYFPEDFQ